MGGKKFLAPDGLELLAVLNVQFSKLHHSSRLYPSGRDTQSSDALSSESTERVSCCKVKNGGFVA